MSARQLALPGLPSRRPPARPRHQAKRDLTEAEFARALHSLYFTPEGDSLRYLDLTGPTARVVDAVTRGNPLRIARRATLSKLVRARKEAP